MALRWIKRLVRKSARRVLGDPQIPPYSVLSYSQEGEDRVIARFLDLDRSPEGFYVDVGAHHPVKYSNTYMFYERGWRGINIDPRPGIARVFQEVRPRDVNLEFGVSLRGGNLDYYEFNEPALNGFSKEVAEQSNGKHGYSIVNVKKIATFPLAQVLDKYLPAKQAIDFLSVDVEGLDEEVLRSNDWGKYRPRLVLAEDLNVRSLLQVSNSPLITFLVEQGYDFAGKTFNTLIFQRKDK